jgi:hypothetical protein
MYVELLNKQAIFLVPSWVREIAEWSEVASSFSKYHWHYFILLPEYYLLFFYN